MDKYINNSFIQINPLLYFVKDHNQEGWIYERYVNLLIYDGIIDYVDNINYSGIFNHIHSYKYSELKNIQTIIDNHLLNESFIIIWIDEYYVHCSHRYKNDHFVHPLIVYGGTKETEKYNAIFFDITKGQVFVSIDKTELITAVLEVKDHYMNGANETAITKTLSVFKKCSNFIGKYHLDVFIKNLSYYLYCTNDSAAEWYDRQRNGLVNNHNAVYGIQLYRIIIDELNSKGCRINYKSLHDFVLHKKYLYERLLYVEKEYDISQSLKMLIGRYGELAESLEKKRLLNMKYQMKNGLFPASLSFDPNYISVLTETLKRGFDIETEILPLILKELQSLKYSKSFLSNHQILELDVFLSEQKEGLFSKQFIFEKTIYANRIDIILDDATVDFGENEIIFINDDYKYLVNKNTNNYTCVHSINIPVMRIQKIEFISSKHIEHTANIICLPGQDSSRSIYDLLILNEYDGLNQMIFCNGGEDEKTFIFLGEDPYIFKTGLAINTSLYRYIFIEMRCTQTSNKAQIFFSNIGSEIWSVDRMIDFDIIPDNEFHTYTIDMYNCKQWKDYVGGIRIDPAHYDSNCLYDKNLAPMCTIRRIFISS